MAEGSGPASTERQRATAEDRLFLQVVRGDPTPEEIAALVAALMAVAAARSQSADGAEQQPVHSSWNAPARRLRAPLHPSPGGWRRSALP